MSKPNGKQADRRPTDGKVGNRSWPSRAIREPTVAFLLAAAALFVGSWMFGSRGSPVIRVDPDELDWRVLQEELLRGGPLDDSQRREVERAYVDEQILVHEALALGLEDDPRIHDILAQKMLHVLSGEVIQPSAEELEAYYADNLERYTPAPTIAVDEVVVAPNAETPMELPDALRDGTPPEELLDDALVSHRTMAWLTLAELADLFDIDFAESVFDDDSGRWVGPHVDERGQHWIRVTDRRDPGPMSLDQVPEQVRLDWIAEREQVLLEERMGDLRRSYGIEYLDDGEAP